MSANSMIGIIFAFVLYGVCTVYIYGAGMQEHHCGLVSQQKYVVKQNFGPTDCSDASCSTTVIVIDFTDSLII